MDHTGGMTKMIQVGGKCQTDDLSNKYLHNSRLKTGINWRDLPRGKDTALEVEKTKGKWRQVRCKRKGSPREGKDMDEAKACVWQVVTKLSALHNTMK